MQWTRLKVSVILFFFIQIIGVLGYLLFEDLSFFDAIYLTIVTVATVGYGDVIPHTLYGRIFTMFLIITGVGMAYYTLTLMVSVTVEGQLKDFWGKKGMDRKIAALKGHIIVCGSGKVGQNAIDRLVQEKEPFVVVESHPDHYKNLVEKKILAVCGDATLDEVLLQAGIERAKGIITALPHDAENVYVTLTAKSLNPKVMVVARSDRPEAEEKLKRAGADTVVFPSVMGGRQLVTAMTKPVIMDLMENVFYNQELHLDIAQITVEPESQLAGKTLVENAIKERFNTLIVAIKRGETLITTPSATEVILPGDILIAIGQRNPLNEMNQLAATR